MQRRRRYSHSKKKSSLWGFKGSFRHLCLLKLLKIAADVFGLPHAIVEFSPSTTLEQFCNDILIEDKANEGLNNLTNQARAKSTQVGRLFSIANDFSIPLLVVPWLLVRVCHIHVHLVDSLRYSVGKGLSKKVTGHDV